MAGAIITQFAGIYPRLPASLLPERAATIAENCDFAYGELRSTKGGFLYSNMSNAPRSIYTDDGLTFYTWTVDVDAVRSPIVNDTFTRMYYTGDGAMKVANRIGTRLTGGTPASPYQVGVPRPTVAPVLTAQAPPTVDSSTATLTWKFHYEYAGVKYQEGAITVTSLGSGKYQFTPPAKTAPPATPEQAVPVIRLTAVALTGGSQIFDLYTNNSSFSSTAGLYDLSMAADATGGTYTITLVAALDESDKETRAYVYTFVNTYNEEGPPSPPATVNTGTTLGVTVGVTKQAAGAYAPIKEIRVYRTPTGSNIASYFYAGSLSVLSLADGLQTFSDTTPAALLNEELTSTNYYPPDAGLVGLMSLPNGILAARKGNEVHFSEAYKPWAWPPAYVKSLPYTTVGGIAYGSGAVITTVTQPYLISGVSPDSMTETRLNVDQAGVSKWSIAVVDGRVLYASNDGLVTIAGGSGGLVEGNQFFTREVWRARYGAGLSGMRFSTWDGRLVAFHASGAFVPFMLRSDEAVGALTDLPSFSAACAFVSPLSDQFYYALGTGIYQFQGGAAQTAVWQSREAVMARPCNFDIAQALVEGTWTLQFYGYDNEAAAFTLKHTENLTTGRRTFRMPSGYETDRYMVKLTGSGRFRELRMAQSGRELASL